MYSPDMIAYILQFLTEELSTQEQEAFPDWLAAHPQHQACYDRIVAIRQQSASAHPPQFDVVEAWQKLHRRMHDSGLGPTSVDT